MTGTPIHSPPIRIANLVELKKKGVAVTCSPTFQMLPVDFTHRTCRFMALVFLCRFSGQIDSQGYGFRKCYARGCPHDLCPRISQAVMIANRYLQRDYSRLEQNGIPVEKRLFTLEASVVGMRQIREEMGEAALIDDYIQMAQGGTSVSVDVSLESVPATEHFEYHMNRQIFLLADFTVKTPEKTASCQRFLGCCLTTPSRSVE